MNNLKINDVYEEPREEQIDTYKCEICGATGKLIVRKGKQFKILFIECPNGHRSTIKKEIDDIFQIGDRIRIYHVPFGKNSKIDFSTFDEGIILNKEKGIINYHLDMKIDKSVFKNKPLKEDSWRYGYIIKGIDSDSNFLELLSPQMRMAI